jgi:hypothetical protein
MVCLANNAAQTREPLLISIDLICQSNTPLLKDAIKEAVLSRDYIILGVMTLLPGLAILKGPTCRIHGGRVPRF